MKTNKWFIISLTIMALSLIAGGFSCSSNNILKSPAGTYSFGSTRFKLDTNGAFLLEHTASAEYKKNYTINGTYTYTLDHVDEENEITYGKIDITVTSLSLEGTNVNSLDFTTIHTGVDVAKGEKLLGWWKYMNLITFAGKMNIKVNLPFQGQRPEDVISGSDVLLLGDPVR